MSRLFDHGRLFRPQRVARVAFHLREAERSGEFSVDTCASDALWTERTARYKVFLNAVMAGQ
ncbi:hypothetical protein CK936_23130 [Streptomyces albireticuli]|uniref:Uncharacterized protein n=1 Tax=Streptomyces albireticuli TaxID=1940 RepID=A0A2A2D540_9ACTN|nr:hypothetical protein CK936_23130 [Streptomyces albireticuli]